MSRSVDLTPRNALFLHVLMFNGLLFLPAAGYRWGNLWDKAADGHYTHRSSSGQDQMLGVYIYVTGLGTFNNKRHIGRSVRLVCLAQ